MNAGSVRTETSYPGRRMLQKGKMTMAFQKLSDTVLRELQEALPGRVLAGEDIPTDYGHDEMLSAGIRTPDAVVRATTTEEVAAACRILYANDIPIIPRGAGTGLSGGCSPIHGGVVIDTSRMNHILGFDLDDQIVRIEAGVLLSDLHAACLDQGMMYPPDPGEISAAVGGNVATNAGGMRAVKYGTTRDYVRTMTVVLPDGRIMHFGGETSKNSSGYALAHLMIGSEGTLGIITELGLKIVPKPPVTVSLLGVYEDLASCIRCVSKVKNSGLDPQALEFIPRDNVDLAETFTGKTVFPHEADGVKLEAYLLTTFECRRDDELDELMESAAEVMMDGGALDVIVYDTPVAMRNAWDFRRSCPEAIIESYDHVAESDIVVPISNITAVVEYARSLEDEVGLKIYTYGHAGDGNIHIKICANEMEEQEFRSRANRFLDLVYAKGKELRALVSGEHGIGSVSVKRLEEYCGTDVMDLMRGIKAVFDPKGLLNPGKVCTYVTD